MTTAQPQQAPSLQAGTNKWLKRLGLLAAGIIGITIIYNLFGSGGGSWGNEWQIYKNVTCPIRWNAQQGWCKIDVPPGTYRITPLYTVWQMGLDNGQSLPIPPKGVSLIDNWANSPFNDEFRRTAPAGHNLMVGALLVKKGNVIIDPFQQEKVILESGDALSIGINLPPKEAYYKLTQAELQVNIEKLVK
ncbi:MAG: hypothetical protein Q7S04_01725 [Candidatus Moranbacteria bacterium]|nr:hypothetical protein [Candidatus Moranbacteria bacterium]